eukprot:4726376-Lingulodinium_polyedra.AAC.1
MELRGAMLIWPHTISMLCSSMHECTVLCFGSKRTSVCCLGRRGACRAMVDATSPARAQALPNARNDNV